MKLHGVIKGKIIQLETDPELPHGQHVLVELDIPTTESSGAPLYDQDFENRITTDPAFESIRQARSLRERISFRLGGNLLNSANLIREDRLR